MNFINTNFDIEQAIAEWKAEEIAKQYYAKWHAGEATSADVAEYHNRYNTTTAEVAEATTEVAEVAEVAAEVSQDFATMTVEELREYAETVQAEYDADELSGAMGRQIVRDAWARLEEAEAKAAEVATAAHA